MEKIKLIHDLVGKTFTVWMGDPQTEHICEETADEVVIMKDKTGKIIGLEILNYDGSQAIDGISVETILNRAS